MRKVGIMAYGHPDDRKRAERVAAAHNLSVSQWIILKIQQAYSDIYGTLELDVDDEADSNEEASRAE